MTIDTTSSEQVEVLLDILRESQQRLAETVAPLDDQGVRADSYDDDWSIAQVLSHLGSQNEIYALIVDAATTGGEAPGAEQLTSIWDAWNAKQPHKQVTDALVSDQALLDRLTAIPTEVRERARLEVFGRERSLAELVQMRLAEHAMHTWDVVVVLDPKATVQASAVGTILRQLEEFIGFIGKTDAARSVLVRTPERELVLSIGPDGGRISDVGSADTDGELSMPTEAFVRLLYGRLDPDHRPSIETNGVTVDDLTPAFPGF